MFGQLPVDNGLPSRMKSQRFQQNPTGTAVLFGFNSTHFHFMTTSANDFAEVVIMINMIA